VASFFLDGPAQRKAEELRPEDLVSGDIRRMFHMATSTAMQDHLIRTFDLYPHFGIDSSEVFHAERIHALLQKRVTTHFVDANSLEIIVQDADRAVAAGMANEIFRELEVLTYEQARLTLERRSTIHREVMDQMQESFDAQTHKLLSIATEFEERAAVRVIDPKRRDPTAELSFQLARTTAKLTEVNEEMATTRRDLELSAALLRAEQMPVLHLARKAFMDIETIPALVVAEETLALSSLVMLLITAVLMLWYKHGQEIMEYMNEVA